VEDEEMDEFVQQENSGVDDKPRHEGKDDDDDDDDCTRRPKPTGLFLLDFLDAETL
jgi:hypothetical protein